MDEDGNEVVLDERESRLPVPADRRARSRDHFRVSRLPLSGARSVALVDLLDAAPPHPSQHRSSIDLADEAPTLHLYVVDDASDCEHPHWRDPLFDEWLDAGVAPGPTSAADGADSAERSELVVRRRRTSRMNASTSMIAAGSMFRPMCTSSQYDSIVTVSAQPVRGPIG